MVHILDAPEVPNYGAEKFIQLYIDKSAEPPLTSHVEVTEFSSQSKESPREVKVAKSESYSLFGKKYKMVFPQKGNIYQRLDQRLQIKRQRSDCGKLCSEK
jgi:hypothetical protein